MAMIRITEGSQRGIWTYSAALPHGVHDPVMGFTHTQHWSDFTGWKPQPGPEEEKHIMVRIFSTSDEFPVSAKTPNQLCLSSVKPKLISLIRPKLVQKSICPQDNWELAVEPTM